MKHLRKFNAFTEAAVAAEPATKPSPSTQPAEPTIAPGTKPERRDRPTPIRRDRPSVTPDPKALKKADAEEVAERFISISKKTGYDIKKHFPKV